MVGDRGCVLNTSRGLIARALLSLAFSCTSPLRVMVFLISARGSTDAKVASNNMKVFLKIRMHCFLESDWSKPP